MKPVLAARRRPLDVPGLDALLSADTAVAVLSAAGYEVVAAEPEYLRLKPGSGAIVSLEIEGRDRAGAAVMVPGYVRLHPAHRSIELMEKWSRLRPRDTALGPGVSLLPDAMGVLFLFPNDAALRALRVVVDPDKLKRSLNGLPEFRSAGLAVRRRGSDLHVVRYKPERRLVAWGDLRLRRDADGQTHRRQVFLRLFPDRRGVRLSRSAEALRAAAGPIVPRPLGTVLDGLLAVEERVAGTEMAGRLEDGTGSGPAVAEVIARLHCSDVILGPPIDPARWWRGVEDGLRMVAAMAPALRGPASTLTARLRRMVPAAGHPVVPMHGDLHLHQILLGPEGPALVDFERAGMGHPMADIGELSAHLLEVSLQGGAAGAAAERFRSEIRERTFRVAPRAWREDEPYFTATGLARRALLRMRRLDPGWEERGAQLLRLALDVSSGGSSGRGSSARRFFQHAEVGPPGFRWEVFHPRPERPWPGHLENADGERRFGTYVEEDDAFVEMRPEHDPALPGMARWTGGGEIVTYRAGRRVTLAVAAADGAPSRYVKVLRPARAGRLLGHARAMEALSAGIPAFPTTPPVMQSDVRAGVLVFEALPGSILHALLAGGPAERALERTASALAALHSVPAPASVGSSRPPWEATVYAEIVARHFPERAAAYRSALASLPSAPRPDGPGRLVHGDLHDRNVLVGADRVAILDLEMLHAGSPGEDVGNLMGHLVLRALQRGATVREGQAQGGVFLEAYRDAGGVVDDDDVAAVASRTLFRLACLYLYRRRWQALTPALLAEAASRGRPPWRTGRR